MKVLKKHNGKRGNTELEFSRKMGVGKKAQGYPKGAGAVKKTGGCDWWWCVGFHVLKQRKSTGRIKEEGKFTG